MKVRHLHAGDFVRQPWKNGGGMTTELAIHAEGERWLWRVSVADVERSGPFSDFAGYERTLVLLEGDGMELAFGGASPVRIDQRYRPFAFDGACRTECRLLGGPVMDLNLMVDRERAAGSIAVVHLHDEARLPAVSPWTLLYCLDGAIVAQVRRIEHRLEPGELLRIDDPEEGALRVRALGTASCVALLHISRL